MIFSVLAWASAGETNGADSAGARPAAPAMAPDVFRKVRRVTERVRLCPPDVIAFLLFAGVGGNCVASISTPKIELAAPSAHRWRGLFRTCTRRSSPPNPFDRHSYS